MNRWPPILIACFLCVELFYTFPCIANSNVQIKNNDVADFFRSLPVCDVFDFTRHGVFGELRLQNKIIDSHVLQQINSELKWRSRANKIYLSGVIRETFRKNIRNLENYLEKNSAQFDSISLMSIAESYLREQKKMGTVGECYEIQSIHGPRLLSTWKETVALTVIDQALIDELFLNSTAVDEQKITLSSNEKKHLESKSLNIEELLELRSIRKATSIFENSTYLKNDLAGSLWNNVKSELLGGKQQVCVDEAETFMLFIRTLKRRGLIKHFFSTGLIYRENRLLGGHVATVLMNLRTEEYFVLDSWHEAGGKPAHITTYMDWLSSNDFNDAVEVKK